MAIDRAVREMLDVEPPAGLRGRVLDRLERPRRGSGWMWIAAPIAAAGVIVLAVMLWQRHPATVAPETTVVSKAPTAQPPAPPRLRPGPEPQPRIHPETPVAKVVTRPARTRQPIAAAVVLTDPEYQRAVVEALPGPAPLGIERLAGPPAPTVRMLDVAPIEVRALEVNAITETPRERREE